MEFKEELTDSFDVIIKLILKVEKENELLKKDVDFLKKSKVENENKIEEERILREESERLIQEQKEQISFAKKSIIEFSNQCIKQNEYIEKLKESGMDVVRITMKNESLLADAKIVNAELKESIILSTENANRGGRKSLLTEDDLELMDELRREGLTLRKIAERLGIGRTTVSRKLKEIESERDGLVMSNAYIKKK